MPRVRQRACLEQGLKLDINKLARQGVLDPNRAAGPARIYWTNTYTGEEVASGTITADMEGPDEGWLRIRIGELNQRIDLRAMPRHFGGRQWYFRCPTTHRRCSVLWMPPGARHFCSRQAWRKQVAYASQFASPVDRAYRGQAKIKSRLIGNRDPDDWDLPPKPSWMRWRTYKQYVQRFESYEDVIEEDMFRQLIRLGIRG
jgi:hypothetical protein